MKWADLNAAEQRVIEHLMNGWEMAHCPGYPQPGFYLHKGWFGMEDRLKRVNDKTFLALREKDFLTNSFGHNDHRWNLTADGEDLYNARNEPIDNPIPDPAEEPDPEIDPDLENPRSAG